MTITELQIGNWCCFLLGKNKDKLSIPMLVCAIYDNEIDLDFEGNEGDPWICMPDELMPIPIEPSILEKNGWYLANGVWVLKSAPRLGWGPRTKELITGYYTFPVAVEFVHTLQNIMTILGIEESIEL